MLGRWGPTNRLTGTPGGNPGLGIVSVALPLSDTVSSIYLVGTGFVFFWVPGLETVVRNFRLGYNAEGEEADTTR